MDFPGPGEEIWNYVTSVSFWIWIMTWTISFLHYKTQKVEPATKQNFWLSLMQKLWQREPFTTVEKNHNLKIKFKGINLHVFYEEMILKHSQSCSPLPHLNRILSKPKSYFQNCLHVFLDIWHKICVSSKETKSQI